MLGVSPSSTPQEREGKATYDRYEVRLQAVQVQGVWRCGRVVRRTRGGSGRRGRGEAPKERVPVSPVWAPGQDRTGHGAPPLARRPHLRPYRLVVPPPSRDPLSDPRPARRGGALGSALGPGQLPLRIPAADLLPVDAAGHRRALAGPGSFDPVRPGAPAHRAPAYRPSHPRADDPRHRRDLLRQGP